MENSGNAKPAEQTVKASTWKIIVGIGCLIAYQLALFLALIFTSGWLTYLLMALGIGLFVINIVFLLIKAINEQASKGGVRAGAQGCSQVLVNGCIAEFLHFFSFF